MSRLVVSESERRALSDALRDMKRGGVRFTDLRQLPASPGILRTALYGARP